MDRRKVAFIYRLFLIASLLAGIILTLKSTAFVEYLLSYYTTQSNLFCLITFSLFLIGDITKYPYQSKKWYPLLKGTIMIAILITAILYLAMLLPNQYIMYTISEKGLTAKRIGNLLVHVISPAMVMYDYRFDEKGNFKLWYPLVWLCFPIFYVGFVYSGKGKFYGIGGSRKFAYFFLDYQKMGVKTVVIWITAIGIGILLLGYALVILDRKLAKK